MGAFSFQSLVPYSFSVNLGFLSRVKTTVRNSEITMLPIAVQHLPG